MQHIKYFQEFLSMRMALVNKEPKKEPKKLNKQEIVQSRPLKDLVSGKIDITPPQYLKRQLL